MMIPPHRLHWVAAALPALLSSLAQAAPAADTTPTLQEVTIQSTLQATTLEQTPTSVSVFDGDKVRDRQWQVNLSESLSGAPGLLLQNRQNYAQDLQLSIRGHGARSTFGVRGIQLYVDGIPATMPDGQGQTNNIDLASVERIEVLRGPYSALYGNASGGVLSAYTERGQGAPEVSSTFAVGSDGQKRLGLKAKGEHNGIGYVLSASRFLTDGYRAQSAADKNMANARLDLDTDEYSHLTLVANAVEIDAQDPGGVTPADWAKDARSVAANPISYNARKTVKQTQAGLTYERKLDGASALRFMAYAGQRSMTQYQSTPRGSQTAAGHAGGVIDLERNYGGIDTRYSRQFSTSAGTVDLIAGLSVNQVKEDRQGYNNFLGSEIGVLGALRRDERNTLTNIDPYVQASWAFAPLWKFDAGLRWSNVTFDSSDRYITTGNGDDSGKAGYHKLLPVLSLQRQIGEQTQAYASVGRGFETPTFNELSYRPDGVGGLNFGLQPSVSTSYEVGVKQRFQHAGMQGEWTAAVFQTDTDDEIVVASNDNGRSSYQNAGQTRRRGVELSTSTWLTKTVQLNGALTVLDARLRDGYCTGTSCIAAGNRLAGTTKSVAAIGLDWKPTADWRLGVDWRRVGRIAANDANSVYAPAYNVTGLSAGYTQRLGAWKLNLFARIDNAFDKKYVGSVIVNDGNGRYYEAAPGRQWMTGATLAYQF